MRQVSLKSPQEILKRLRELIHKHKKKFLKKYTAPSVENCNGALSCTNPELAEHLDPNEDRCTRCKSRMGFPCARQELFEPKYSKEEIVEMFKEDIKNPQKLPREYKDVALLMWVLGFLDPEEAVLEDKEKKDVKK